MLRVVSVEQSSPMTISKSKVVCWARTLFESFPDESLLIVSEHQYAEFHRFDL